MGLTELESSSQLR
ncbi:hypothetical protein Avbf_13651 [Armadillidium vulgare]|nr:hypothetical protein Avbf_13651 [Armadillidium vulgare]